MSNELLLFYQLSHIGIAAIGSLLTAILYFNIRKRFSAILEEASQKRVDKGMLSLSIAFFIWVIAGTWTIIVDHFQIQGTLIDAFIFNLCSLLNSIFLILSLFYIPYAPKLLYQNQRNIQKIIIGFISITTISFILSQFIGEATTSQKLLVVADLLMSFFVSGLLALALFNTFVKRGMFIVAIVSVIVALFIFISQFSVFLEGTNWNFYLLLMKLVSKTSLIFLCLVLATTWVIGLANTPKSYEMEILFLDWSSIRLTISSKNILQQEIDFGAKTTQFKNLLKFAIRRKYGTGKEQAIEVGKGGELKSQTYLTRILDNINEITDQEELALERKDLFTFLGEGQYRLRILPEHISIESNLLQEFTEQIDNQLYKTFCNNL